MCIFLYTYASVHLYICAYTQTFGHTNVSVYAASTEPFTHYVTPGTNGIKLHSMPHFIQFVCHKN